MVLHKKFEHSCFSLAEREKVYFDLKGSNGGVLIQTCNRVELYVGEGFVNRNIVEHLYCLTSGLQSKLIGETSIQGQVKQAYLKAAENEQLSPTLHRLFQSAIRVGKLVRNETHISEGAMSHSQATVQVIEKNIRNLSGAKIILLGAHNMNETILQFLQRKGANNVFISNRKYIKALQLADQYKCRAFQFDQVANHLMEADVIISATSAPHLIIRKEQVSLSKEQLMVDLAVPRDIDPEIASLQNIRLFNVEDIEKQIEQNVNGRLSEIELAREIIKSEVDKFMAWLKKRFEHGNSKKDKGFIAA